MEFTDSDELRRDILANQYLPEHLRERAKNDTSEYCRAEDADNLLEVDRLTGGQAQVPTIWLYAGFALMLIALGVMMPMLRMRMAATKRTGKHMPITGGKHAK